ncbi:MAG TPA: FtsX-like permease family protein, partial [Bryobacteraceae bacterium]
LGRGGVAIFRTSQDPIAIERSIREEITALDPTVPVTMETLDARVDRFRERPRFTAALVSLFAVFGWILAAVGLYGVLSFLVSRRTREIGVRMALGATPAKIVALISGEAFAMVGAGLAAGVIAAAALTRLIQGLLFEISPEDPVSFGLAILALVAAAGLAAWIPSRRAAAVDPAVALRSE